MTNLNKRAVDSLAPLSDRDVFAWDGEVRGFGVRVKPSGVKTYFIQYRNTDGRTRRMVIGKHCILTIEEAGRASDRPCCHPHHAVDRILEDGSARHAQSVDSRAREQRLLS